MFKEIKNWPGYFIYADGRVWSEKTKRFLKPQPNIKGYLRVCLSNGSVKKCIPVHKLVAEGFIINDSPETKTEINHIDENIANNNIENLEWVTPYENLHYGTRSERIGRANGRRVRQYSLNGDLLAVYESCAAAARVTGLNRQGINNCALGKTKTSGNYLWKWEDEE